MKKIICFVLECLLMSLFLVHESKASDWRFQMGLSYISGYGDIVDLYKENLKTKNYAGETSWFTFRTSSWEVPVGISIQFYRQIGSGFRFGGGVGPAASIEGDYSFYDVPLSVNAGYTFLPSADISPYVKLGVAYHIAGGDYIENSTPGIIAGVGIEFMEPKKCKLGIELCYDSSEIEFQKYNMSHYYYSYSIGKEKIKPNEYILSFYVIY